MNSFCMPGNVTGEIMNNDILIQNITHSKASFIDFEGIYFMKQYTCVYIEYDKKEQRLCLWKMIVLRIKKAYFKVIPKWEE